MKRFIVAALTLAMSVSTVGCTNKSEGYTPGTYTGTSKGFGGNVTVTLTVNESGITDASIEGNDETPTVGQAAFEKLVEEIKTKKSAEIDGVSGATLTSNAVKEATKAALNQALGTASTAVQFKEGTYTGTAQGMWEPISVEVKVSKDKIESVTVTDCKDTPIISNAAVKEMPERIVAEQSLAVDTSSGATVSSNGIIDATKAALSQASDDISSLSTPLAEKEVKQLPDEDYDIVIVGAGGAGLTAALEASKTSDYSVLVLEKEAWLGGATALSGSGISVGGTIYNESGTLESVISKTGEPANFTGEQVADYFEHKVEGLSDNNDNMTVNRDLIIKTFDKASTYYPFLVEEGLEQDRAVVTKSFDDTGKIGITGMIGTQDYAAGEIWGDWLSQTAMKYGAEVRTNSPVTSLINTNGEVTGVVVEGKEGTYKVNAKKVILATGGFSANRELLEEQNKDVFPHIEDVFTFTSPGCTGDALEWIKDFDGATTGYGLQVNFGVSEPYAFETTYGNEAFATYCDVDSNGNRYVDELVWYYDKGDAFRTLPEGYGYAILNEKDYFSAPHHPEMTFEEWANYLIEKGWMYEADTLDELAKKINVDPANLAKSVEDYNAYCASGVISDFGYPPTPLDTTKKVYAMRMQMCVTDTMYGVKMDSDFHVLNTKDEAIPNLYAAGTVGFGNYELQKYFASTTAIAIAVYGGALAAEEAVKALDSAK